MSYPSDNPKSAPGDVPPVVHESKDDRLWALLAHIAPLVGLTIVAALVIWLVKKDDSPFVEDQAKEALNFQLAVLIAMLVTSCTVIVPVIVFVGLVVYSVLAAIEANKGNYYRYPYTFRLIN